MGCLNYTGSFFSRGVLWALGLPPFPPTPASSGFACPAFCCCGGLFPGPWSPTLGLVHAMMQYSVLVGYLVAGIRSLLRLSLPSLGGFIPSRLCLIFFAFCSFPCYCLLLVLFPPLLPSFLPSFLPLLSSLVPCSRSLSRILLSFPLSSCRLSSFLLFPFFFQRESGGFLEGRVLRVIRRPFLHPWVPTPCRPPLPSLSPFPSPAG